MSAITDLNNIIAAMNKASAVNLDQTMRLMDEMVKSIANIAARVDALENRLSPPINLPGA